MSDNLNAIPSPYGNCGAAFASTLGSLKVALWKVEQLTNCRIAQIEMILVMMRGTIPIVEL